jgi:hypothetical protein
MNLCEKWWRISKVKLKCGLRLCDKFEIVEQKLLEICEKKNKSSEIIMETVKKCVNCGREVPFYTWEE